MSCPSEIGATGVVTDGKRPTPAVRVVWRLSFRTTDSDHNVDVGYQGKWCCQCSRPLVGVKVLLVHQLEVFFQRTSPDSDQKAAFREIGVMATPIELELVES